jgi:two-component system OmpR family response regulator
MKTLTKHPNCLVDDKRFLTSIKPAEKYSFYPDTCFELSPEKGKKEMKVFLVDDDLMYLTAMEYYLSMEMPSLKVKTFQTGESSLMEMEQHPDFVILDYYLDSQDASAEDGINILRKIKNLYPDTKVIMLSCQDEIKVAMDCIKNGAYDYVSKGQTAFVRIKNILMNVAGYNGVIRKITKKMRVFKIAHLVILVILILFFLLSNYIKL